MISSFAAYLLLVSILFAGGAWASEQAFLVRRWPRRFLWLATLAASVLFPLAMALNTVPAHKLVRTTPAAQPEFLSLGATEHVPASQPGPEPVQASSVALPVALVAPRSPVGRSPGHLSLDLIVSIVWLSSSMATALWYLLAGFRLVSLVRRAPCANVQGASVRMTQVGPAVFGVVRPAILWPRWLDEAPAATRAAAIAHETQHLAVRDPLVLVLGLLLVVLAPWNPALWWQLRQMRFAMEADCDQRVVRGGIDENAYALALLQIAEHRASGAAGLAMLMSAPTWLEQRVRIVLQAPRRRRLLLAAVGVPLALGAWAAIAQLPVPSLRSAEFRKLPAQDTRPGADWARAIAQSRYPELFDRHFDGTAVVAAIFNRDGTLKLVDKHEFAPGVAPSDFDMRTENERAGVLNEDLLYNGAEGADLSSCWGCTVGPWLETVNPGRVFVVYEVLRWEPDPSRSFERARTALQAAEPQLYSQYAGPFRASSSSELPWEKLPQVLLAMFINDDGGVAQLSKQIVRDDEVPDNALFNAEETVGERFSAMGIPKERLGRVLCCLGVGHLWAFAAWHRRPDDPPDVWDVSFSKPATDLLRTHPPRVDTQDEERIATRYFHDLQMNGPQAITEVVAGQTTLRMPWVLVGTDGQVWDAGLSHSYPERPVLTGVFEEIAARYPGIVLAMPFFVGHSWHPDWRISGVPVVTVWISAKSPIQGESDTDLQKRNDILVTGGLAGACEFYPPKRDVWDNQLASEASCGSLHWYWGSKGLRQALVPFAAAVDLGVPAIIQLPSFRHLMLSFDAPVVNSAERAGGEELPLGKVSDYADRFELTVTQTTRERVKMHVRTLPSRAHLRAEPTGPTRTVDVEAPYGQATAVDLPGDTPDQQARLVLRVERLKQ
jgi:beta-lactamase regulating signal transducer with metallopeptidase domain